MATRVVEGKKPYTGGKAISIDENKVISLNLRDENNLIIYDEGDDEIYVDLQLPDGIEPTDAFPVGVTTGRAVVADGWDKAGTIISAKTTSGDEIKILYADDGTLWIDNGTGTFKQIYFKADVDALLLALRNYIDGELAKKQNGVSSDTAPSNPSEGDLWYDTTSSSMKVWDGTAWQSVGGGSDIVYATQAEYNALPSSKLTDNKHYFIYTPSVVPVNPIPQNGLIGYYSFENDTNNDTVIHDESGLGNNGVRDATYGEIVTGGKVGTYCLYKNTDSKTPASVGRTVTFDYSSSTGVSFMGWIKTVNSAYCCGLGGFFDWIAPYDNQRSIALRGDNNITLLVGNNSGGEGLEVNNAVNGDGGVWTHYAVTFGSNGVNNTVKIYRNGIEVYTQDTNYFYSGTSPFYFISLTSGRGKAGYCDDVAVYNRVLTASEISDYYTATA